MNTIKLQLSMLALLGVIFFSLNAVAFACDLCSIYSAQNIKEAEAEKITVGVNEQFSSFNSVRLNGNWVPNIAHQSLSSSITQLYGRYDFTNDLGLQLTLPYINRDFKRSENGELQKGNESGIGDLSILALYSPLRISDGDFFARLSVRGGLKLPTGDSSRIREETEDNDEKVHSAENQIEKNVQLQMVSHAGHHHQEEETIIPSGIHGHDLALGSGSLDYIVGTTGLMEKGKYFAVVDLQYAFRTEGDFNYRYQNDLLWSLGAGRYLLTEDENSFSLKANLSGEYKGMDIFEGNKVEDTGINSMFLGPEINFTVGKSLFGFLALDLPLLLDNTSFQVVPDYRLRWAITYLF